MPGPGYLVTGRYRLLSKIGSGAMGAVWLARDEMLSREVAVKQVITTAAAGSEEAEDQRRRSMREGRIAARLTHPHAIAMYDVALDGGQPWLVMEYLPSASLAQVVQSRQVLPFRQVAQIGAQVADAMAAAHAAGVVHRDIKPGNVLVGEGGANEGVVKITDFGISRAQGDVTVTKTGVISGTPAYFAPEVARGQDPTEASDVFSLGATLFASVEGVPPFGLDDNAIALLHRVARGEVSTPTRSGDLTGALLRMLEPHPDNRPTMAEVRDELAEVAAGGRGAVADVLSARTAVLPVGAALGGAALGAAGARAATPEPTLVGTTTGGSGPPPTGGPGPRPGAAGAAPRPRRAGVSPPVLAAAAVAVVLAALAAYLIVTGAGSDSGTTAQNTTAQSTTSTTSTAEPNTSTTEATPSPTTAPPSATTPPAAPAAPAEPTAEPNGEDVTTALQEYYGLLPDDIDAAFDRGGPTLQSQGLDSFRDFWAQFDAVRLDDVQEQGPRSATIEITFVRPDGSSQRERHDVTLVDGEDGRLLVDVDQFDTVLSSTEAGDDEPDGDGDTPGNQGRGNGGSGG